MAGENSSPLSALRLRGEVEGISRSFLLSTPVVRLGAHRGCDVVLPISGVSRNHAVLTLDAEGVTVEDRGSKNGTKVNGARVAHARLALGDELTVGIATLHLEAVEPEDARLALIFDSGPELERSVAVGDSRETDLMATPATVSTAAQLQWLESFVERRTRPGTGLAEALGDLNQQLGGVAVGVVTWHRDAAGRWSDPAILGVAGNAQILSHSLDRHRTLFVRAQERALDAGWQLEIVGDDLAAGLLPIAGGGVAALVISGTFPGRSTCGPWLRLLCRLVAVFEDLEDASASPAPTVATHRLSFPAGFVAGRSTASQGLYRELEMACGGNYPVLILGETGSGKELVARTLHRSSPRSQQPFVAVNCAAIPADLLEAEMFGVARGAATGVAPRPGCFQRATGGTLFLDEIGEMQPELQAKLLRVLENGEMQPVGGSPVRLDVRVLSATNVDVEQRITDGDFRADLYYRLAASMVTVPPLRQRPADLPALIQHFVDLSCQALGVRLRGLSQRALDVLIAYPWPGNVRELQHMLRRIVQTALPGQVLDSALLPAKLRNDAFGQSLPMGDGPGTSLASDATGSSSLDLRERVAEVEKSVIREALARSGGHRILTAKLLGISRNTLAAKMRLHDLSAP